MKKTIEDAYNEVKWCDVLRVFIVVLIMGGERTIFFLFIFLSTLCWETCLAEKFFYGNMRKQTYRKIQHIYMTERIMYCDGLTFVAWIIEFC